jgi:hypothetical protein
MKLNLPPKLVEKLVWVLVISFCKIFIPNYMFGVFSSCSKSADFNCSGTQMCLPIVFAKLSWTSKDLLHWIIMSPSKDVKPLLFIHVFFFGELV